MAISVGDNPLTAFAALVAVDVHVQRARLQPGSGELLANIVGGAKARHQRPTAGHRHLLLRDAPAEGAPPILDIEELPDALAAGPEHAADLSQRASQLAGAEVEQDAD